jgi:parvulin-like peptidyl-prolyl isomerase
LFHRITQCLFFAFAVFMLIGARAKEEHGGVIAEVNGSAVTMRELQAEIERQLPDAEAELSTADLHVVRARLLQKIIDRRLLVAAANKANVPPPTAQEIERYRTRIAAKAQVAGQTNFDEQVFLAELESDLAILHYLETQVFRGASPEIVDAPVLLPDQVRLRIIELKADLDSDVEELIARLRERPGSFAQLARERSRGAARAKGGDFGFLTENQLPPFLDRSVMSLEVSTVIGPLPFGESLFLVKIEQKKGGSIEDGEGTRQTAYDALLYGNQARLLSQHLQELRSSATIIIYLK